MKEKLPLRIRFSFIKIMFVFGYNNLYHYLKYVKKFDWKEVNSIIMSNEQSEFRPQCDDVTKLVMKILKKE